MAEIKLPATRPHWRATRTAQPPHRFPIHDTNESEDDYNVTYFIFTSSEQIPYPDGFLTMGQHNESAINRSQHKPPANRAVRQDEISEGLVKRKRYWPGWTFRSNYECFINPTMDRQRALKKKLTSLRKKTQGGGEERKDRGSGNSFRFSPPPSSRLCILYVWCWEAPLDFGESAAFGHLKIVCLCHVLAGKFYNQNRVMQVYLLVAMPIHVITRNTVYKFYNYLIELMGIGIFEKAPNQILPPLWRHHD